MFEWCEIPEGDVTLTDVAGYLTTPTTWTLDTFLISKYPVTNAQYVEFVRAEGYEQPQWWDEFGWSDVQRAPQKTRYWVEDALKLSHHPVIGITWYEACAYCRWASSLTQSDIQLPTEQQWQRAAQGDDFREYPYGNEFDPQEANTEVSNIQKTTPVDFYKGGMSPFGVMDMSGNVYEWCSTPLAGEQNEFLAVSRMIRGGSFKSNAYFTRVTSRNFEVSFHARPDIGFRVVSRLPISG